MENIFSVVHEALSPVLTVVPMNALTVLLISELSKMSLWWWWTLLLWQFGNTSLGTALILGSSLTSLLYLVFCWFFVLATLVSVLLHLWCWFLRSRFMKFPKYPKKKRSEIELQILLQYFLPPSLSPSLSRYYEEEEKQQVPPFLWYDEQQIRTGVIVRSKSQS